MTDKTDPRAGMVHVEVTPAARPAEQQWMQLAEQHKGRADDCGALARAVLAARPAAPQAMDDLHAFVDAAAGEGLVLGDVDAADLYVALFPERYAAALSQAAPAQPAPSAQGPAELWLQLHGDCDKSDLSEPLDYTGDDVTWCWHQIHSHDVRYVRADLAQAQPAQADDGDLLDLASLGGIVPLTVSAGDLDGEAQPAQQPDRLGAFHSDTLADIAESLETGYERTINVGDECPSVESTTAYAARFIRAYLAQQPDPRDEALRVAREALASFAASPYIKKQHPNRTANALDTISRIDALTTKESGNG